jgi:hypothetical protein
MTRKDFEAVAAALREASQEACTPEQRETHRECCRCVARALVGANPRFDMARFLAASGAL